MKHPGIPLYTTSFFFSLGLRGSSSYTPFLGPDEALWWLEGASSGSKGSEKDVMGWVPLRAVLIEDFSPLDGQKESP